MGWGCPRNAMGQGSPMNEMGRGNPRDGIGWLSRNADQWSPKEERM